MLANQVVTGLEGQFYIESERVIIRGGIAALWPIALVQCAAHIDPFSIEQDALALDLNGAQAGIATHPVLAICACQPHQYGVEMRVTRRPELRAGNGECYGKRVTAFDGYNLLCFPFELYREGRTCQVRPVERDNGLDRCEICAWTQLYLFDESRRASLQPDELPDTAAGSKRATIIIVAWPAALLAMRNRKLVNGSLDVHHQFALAVF